jgi:hypothetical protein
VQSGLLPFISLDMAVPAPVTHVYEYSKPDVYAQRIDADQAVHLYTIPHAAADTISTQPLLLLCAVFRGYFLFLLLSIPLWVEIQYSSLDFYRPGYGLRVTVSVTRFFACDRHIFYLKL